MADTPLKIVYITPAIYSAGGVERVIALKATYFAEQYGYDVTIIVTEGKGRDSFFSLFCIKSCCLKSFCVFGQI